MAYKREAQPYRQVLVAVDATDDARLVLGKAVDVAAMSGALVSIVSVVRPVEQSFGGVKIESYGDAIALFAREAERQVRLRVDEWASAFGIAGEAFVRQGHPATEIRAVAEELGADLIAIGTHARHGMELLLGSTANAVLHGAKTDVLAVRLPD